MTAAEQLRKQQHKGPFPHRDCDVANIAYIGVYGTIPTGDSDCNSDVVIAKMGSVLEFGLQWFKRKLDRVELIAKDNLDKIDNCTAPARTLLQTSRHALATHIHTNYTTPLDSFYSTTVGIFLCILTSDRGLIACNSIAIAVGMSIILT